MPAPVVDHPKGDELLCTARQLLLDDLLPALPPERRYEALMIANVMAISAREFEAGELVATEQIRRLEALCFRDAPPVAGLSVTQRIAILERMLVADIRGGRFDDASGRALRDVLGSLTRARLRISNPKYLREWDSTHVSPQTEHAR